MKNLFFNVPARRNFLKSNASEMRHIIDEFSRIAIAFPGIFFSLTSNGQEVFHLGKGTLKQRLVQILGNNYTSKLVTVNEDTDYMNIYGFVGKPDVAKKTRGDQFFFVNSRFIKSAYLNHAVMNAFSDMIAKDSYPMYALFIDIDPSRLDINVHPTKQEIKFEDEKLIYAFVQSAIKHALAQFSISPTLDFDLDISIQQTEALSKPFTDQQKSSATSSSLFNTFTQKHQAHFIERKSNLQSWEETSTPAHEKITSQPDFLDEFSNRNFTSLLSSQDINKIPTGDTFIQLHQTFIIAQNNNGFIAIHQQNAHERILYEKFANAVKGKPIATQRSLFPLNITLTPHDAIIMSELFDDLQLLGYQVEPFGNNTFIIQGTPADVAEGNEKVSLENMLEHYKNFSNDVKYSKREKLLRSMAWQNAVKPGQVLAQKEMKTLADDLFNCESPNTTPNGKPCYLEFKKDELNKMFGR